MNSYNKGIGKTCPENTLSIMTPEGVEFSFNLAGPVSRCMSITVDLAVVFTVVWCVSVLSSICAVFSPEIAPAISVFTYFIVSIGYGIFLEWRWNGQTLGKRMIGIRVIDAGGMRLRFSQVTIRNLMRSIDSLPFFYLTGGISSILSPLHQRLGDYAAQTIVVRIRHSDKPDLSKIMPDKFNSFRSHPEIIGMLRSKMPVELTMLILNSLLRKDALEPETRNKIYSAMAELVQKTAKFPPETIEGLSDERYLKNFIDVIFRK